MVVRSSASRRNDRTGFSECTFWWPRWRPAESFTPHSRGSCFAEHDAHRRSSQHARNAPLIAWLISPRQRSASAPRFADDSSAPLGRRSRAQPRGGAWTRDRSSTCSSRPQHRQLACATRNEFYPACLRRRFSAGIPRTRWLSIERLPARHLPKSCSTGWNGGNQPGRWTYSNNDTCSAPLKSGAGGISAIIRQFQSDRHPSRTFAIIRCRSQNQDGTDNSGL